MNEHIQRLEEKLAHMEHSVAKLNQVLIDLQEENAQLKARVQKLAEQMQEQAPSLFTQLGNEPPPHY